MSAVTVVNSAFQRARARMGGLSLLEMLVAMVIVGVGVAATYRSLGDSAAKTHELQQRQQAWLLLEGLLQAAPDRVPQPLPQHGQRGDFSWSIEPEDGQAAPILVAEHAEGTLVPSRHVQPVALRYTVWWGQERRSISVVSWRLAPSGSRP